MPPFNGYFATIYTIDKGGAQLIHSIERANTTERTKRLAIDAAVCFVAKQDKKEGQFYGLKIESKTSSCATFIVIDAANLLAVVYESGQPVDAPYIFKLMHAQKIGQAVNIWHNDLFKINYNQRVFDAEKKAVYSFMKKNGSIRAEKNRLALFAKSKNIIPDKLNFSFKIKEYDDYFRIAAY
jgi:ureidoglycolate hydrolase